MWTLSPKSYKAAFAVVFTILVGIGIASYVMSDRFANSEESVIHTHQAISEIKSMSAELSEAESSRRAFELTNDPTVLIEFDVALEALPRHLQALRSMTVDNLAQQQRLIQIQPLLDQRLALLKQSVESQKQDPSAADQRLVFTRQGIVLADKIRSLLNEMEREETQLLHERSSQSAGRQRKATMILVLAFLLASMVLVSLFLLMSTEVARRTWAESLAKDNEEKFRLLVSGIQDHAIIRVDLEGRIITWNQGAERLFGFHFLRDFGRILRASVQHLRIRYAATALAHCLGARPCYG